MSTATMSSYLIGFPKQSGKGFASESIVLENKYEDILNATFLNFPMPEITPEPDGDIAFEWSDDYGRTFVFSIDDNQTLTYAGIFGANNTHGTELLGDFIPDPIINYLKRLYSK